MKVNAKIQANINPEKLLEAKQLGRGQGAELFLANELRRISDSYVPFKDGALKNLSSIKRQNGTTYIEYNSPYARFHWHGEKMVDPDMLVQGFQVGGGEGGDRRWVSRRGVKKVRASLTSRASDPGYEIFMTYQGAPKRGPRWTLRAFVDNKEALETAIVKYIER